MRGAAVVGRRTGPHPKCSFIRWLPYGPGGAGMAAHRGGVASPGEHRLRRRRRMRRHGGRPGRSPHDPKVGGTGAGRPGETEQLRLFGGGPERLGHGLGRHDGAQVHPSAAGEALQRVDGEDAAEELGPGLADGFGRWVCATFPLVARRPGDDLTAAAGRGGEDAVVVRGMDTGARAPQPRGGRRAGPASGTGGWCRPTRASSPGQLAQSATVTRLDEDAGVEVVAILVTVQAALRARVLARCGSPAPAGALAGQRVGP